jgi:hypothetical protein
MVGGLLAALTSNLRIVYTEWMKTSTVPTQRRCACGAPARPRQWDCHSCHRVRQKKYRDRDAAELRRFRHLERFKQDDATTKAAFEAQFITRNVIVTYKDGSSEPAKVMGFRPAGVLRLRRWGDGSEFQARMDMVMDDAGFIDPEQIG